MHKHSYQSLLLENIEDSILSSQICITVVNYTVLLDLPGDYFLQAVGRCYSSNKITKKESKFDDPLSTFDWHDLSPIFFAHNIFFIT